MAIRGVWLFKYTVHEPGCAKVRDHLSDTDFRARVMVIVWMISEQSPDEPLCGDCNSGTFVLCGTYHAVLFARA